MKSELGVILAVVLLGLMSIFFGVMYYLNSGEINGQTPGDSMEAKATVRKREIKDIQDKIEEYQVKLTVRSEALDRERDAYEALKVERINFEKRYTDRQGVKKEGEEFAAQASAINGKVSELKGKTLASINKEVSLERERMDKNVDTASKQKTEAQSRVLNLKEAYTKDAKLHLADMNYQKSQLSDTKEILKDLTQREPVHAVIHNRAAGKVILSDPLRNFVAINIGTGAGVKNGFRFEIYTIQPGNKHKTKAYGIVRNAGVTQSECMIDARPIELPTDTQSGYVATEPEEIYSPVAQSGKKGFSAEIMTATKTVMSGQNMMDPVVEGDLIQNPFFDAGRQIIFYIAGSKEVVGERQKSAIRYRWTEIKDMAERYGAKVVAEVDTNVNYVIAQKNPGDDPEYKKAVDFGIPIVYEWELFRFLDNK